MLLYLVGAALSLGHVLLLSKANPGRELPWVGRPANTTRVDLAIYLVATVCVLRAASGGARSVGTGPAYLLALAALLVPVVVLTGLHNARVRRHSSSADRS